MEVEILKAEMDDDKAAFDPNGRANGLILS